MMSHVNHEGAVTVPKTHTLVLLVLSGVQLELLLYAAGVVILLDQSSKFT